MPSLGLCVCEEEGGDGAGLVGVSSSLNSGAWCGRNKSSKLESDKGESSTGIAKVRQGP